MSLTSEHTCCSYCITHDSLRNPSTYHHFPVDIWLVVSRHEKECLCVDKIANFIECTRFKTGMGRIIWIRLFGLHDYRMQAERERKSESLPFPRVYLVELLETPKSSMKHRFRIENCVMDGLRLGDRRISGLTRIREPVERKFQIWGFALTSMYWRRRGLELLKYSFFTSTAMSYALGILSPV